MTSDANDANPVQIYLFRHGETDWNRERRFQGHTDIPLNDLGREQARALLESMRELKLQVILTSDLLRAKETAQILNAELKLPLIISSELRECRIGDPEGKLRESIIAEYGSLAWDRWLSVKAEDHEHGFPNGETKSDHLKRLIKFVEAYCKENPKHKRIAISTHGGSVRRLVHHCVNAPVEPIPLPNCALYEVSFNLESGSWVYVRSVSGSADRQTSVLDANVWGKTKD